MAIAEKASGRTEQGFELSLTQESYRILDPIEFTRDFQNEADCAKQRVWAKSMVVEQGHAPGLFLNSVYKAAVRGLDTKLLLDKHSGKVGGDNSDLQEVLNQNKLTDLWTAGVKINHTNPPKGFMPKIPVLGKYSGRDHIKIYIVDDIVWLGGINLESNNFNNIDFVVKTKNPSIVEFLASQFDKSYDALMDYELNPDPQTRILVDIGRPRESKILDEAIKLVDGAEQSIQNFSMLLPDGKFLHALKRAKKRGVPVDVLTSKPEDLSVMLSKMVQKVSRVRYSFQHQKDLSVIQARKFVHAKYLGVDGKVAMFGSHNLSGQGVFLGTEEIAMVTTNPQLVGDLGNFFQEELAAVSHK